MSARVLVCGSRNYNNAARVWSVLDHYEREAGGFDCLIHGGASGTDTIAGEWADARGVRVLPFPADWRGLGPSAGPIRNAQMLRDGRPTVIIAFQGGNGTDNMIDQAERARVPVLRVPA